MRSLTSPMASPKHHCSVSCLLRTRRRWALPAPAPSAKRQCRAARATTWQTWCCSLVGGWAARGQAFGCVARLSLRALHIWFAPCNLHCFLSCFFICYVQSANVPGRLEFAGYLPPNCQAALIQPVGKDGVLVVGSDTQRGFSRLDQVRDYCGTIFGCLGWRCWWLAVRDFSRLDQVSTGWVIGHIERVGRGLSMGCLASMGSCCPGLCAAAWFAAPSCRPWQTSWGLATVAKESEAETGQASHLSLPRPGCRAWRTSWRWRWSGWGPAAASSSSSEHPRQTPVWGPWQLATQPTMKLLLCCILPHTDQNVTHAYKQGRACKCGLHAAAIWLRERACDQLAACGTAPPVLHMPLGCQWQCTETPARN